MLSHASDLPDSTPFTCDSKARQAALAPRGAEPVAVPALHLDLDAVLALNNIYHINVAASASFLRISICAAYRAA